MSRKDTYHDLVKQLLIQEGWTVTHDPYYLEADPKLAIDLGAEQTIAAEKGTEKIAVEIKSFVTESQVVELEKAMGQYGIYEGLLQEQEPERELYLAVPRYAFENIFSKHVGQVALRIFRVNLLIFALEGDEPLIWKKQ